MASTPTLIVGGGIAGLTAALACARWGDVLILEREAEFLPVGAGLQLGPNAVRALRALGAWEAVEPVASSPPELHIRDGRSGRLIRRFDLGVSFEQRFGAPYRVALRGDLHAALLSVVRANSRIRVEMGRSISTLADLQGARVIVADGIHSILRQQIYPELSPFAHEEVFQRGLLPGLMRSLEIDLSPVTLWMMPGGHVVHYLVGPDQLLNIVHVHAASKDSSMSRKRMAPSLNAILGQVETWTQWPAWIAPPLPSWNVGNATFIGDAAHGTLPYLAQGAAMALEDAAALLEAAPDLVARMRRTRRLHSETLKAGQTYHLDGIAAKARNAVLAVMPESLFWNRLSWLYGSRLT